MNKYLALFLVLCISNIQLFGQNTNVYRTIKVDYNQSAGLMNTMFKECIGAGRANEGLRADWQQQLAMVKKNAISNTFECTDY
jgi:xylan 1,4-beta-xylosidase